MSRLARIDETTTFHLLMRLFLRRLIDNDLLSPHADRHESFAVLYALILSLAVFVTFFLSTNYLSAFVQLPGPAALSALADRFLFIAASITISAVGALIVWEALAVEPRDAAILGPLPIGSRLIARAKLAAAMGFGALLVVALNAIPSVLYPLFLTLNIRGASGRTILALIGTHALTVTMAGLFGFVGILALRGVIRVSLGERIFQRLSSSVQSVLVVGMVTALLLAPTIRAKDVRSWIRDGIAAESPARPVLWFLALNERLAGYRINETPVVPPPRFTFDMIPRDGDDLARAIYRTLQPRLGPLARNAWLSLLAVTAAALATFLWINRRLPDRIASASTPPLLNRIARGLVERSTQHDPEMQAGLFFTLQTLNRSAPHRTVMAIAVAVGLTHAVIAVTQGGGRAAAIASASLSTFAIALVMLLALLAGIAYATIVPAEPAASWTIRMAWLGDERRYLGGVKFAALLLVAALLIVLLPVHLALLGIVAALAHSLCCTLLAIVVIDALLLRYRRLPFACSYLPIQNPKLVWPAAFAGLLFVSYQVAAAERWALQTAPRTALLIVALGAIALLVRALDRTWRLERQPLNFDDRPALPTQRLGLFEHIATHD